MTIAFDLNTTLVNLCCPLSTLRFTSCRPAISSKFLIWLEGLHLFRGYSEVSLEEGNAACIAESVDRWMHRCIKLDIQMVNYNRQLSAGKYNITLAEKL